MVIITGGSSGIGLALIKAFERISPATRVCNLSRSVPPSFPGDLHFHIPCDLTGPGEVARAAAEVTRLLPPEEAGPLVLINNSGFGDYGRLQAMELSKQLEMIDLNVRAAVELTLRLLPGLRRRGGVVVNVASTAAFLPTPYLSTYGATKAFLLNWTLALHNDLRGSGVRALAVCPGPTESNFFRRAGFSGRPANLGMGMTAEAVAAATLRALAGGRALVVTGWRNKLLAAVVTRLPKVWAAGAAAAVLGRVRRKGLAPEDGAG